MMLPVNILIFFFLTLASMDIVQPTSTSANVLVTTTAVVTEKENESGSTNQPIYLPSAPLPVISYNQPKFCPNPSWNSTATISTSINRAGRPVQDIFIDKNNTVYVAMESSPQLVMYINGNIFSISDILDSLASPTSLFVAPNNDLYVAYGLNSGYYINKWTSVNWTNRALLINTNNSCGSLFIDINYNIYCSITKLHQVMKYSLNNGVSLSTIAAGHGLSGTAADMLSSPMGIFVDTNFYLYVADHGNDRIQLFIPGQMNGTSVAGSGSTDSFALNGPTSVILDGNKYLFIADGNSNGRIVQQGPNGFQCVIGCSSTDYLVDPFSMRFDNQGDIVVCDNSNQRIQMFTLTTQLCEIDQPTTSSTVDAGSTKKDQLTSATKAESTMKMTTASLQPTSRFTSEKYAATTDPTMSVETTIRTHISTVSGSLTTPNSLSTKISETISMMKIATTIASNDFSEETSNALTTHDEAISATTTAESFVDSTNVLIDSLLYSTMENERSSSIQMLTTTTTIENEKSSLIQMLTITTTMASITAVPSTSFVPNSCPNSDMMGSFCDISSAPCDTQKPCQNMGTCINSITIPQGYIYACPSGFNGAICELDLRPCKSTTCWNNGSCSMPMTNNFQCSCLWGWEGSHCEKKVDYCQNITCLNHGICRSLFLGYKCECLPGLYSGSHCEYTAEYIVTRQYTSKSLAYIAITVMSSFVLFIVTLDILKYVFHIDVTRQKRERIQQKRILQKRKAVVSKEPRIALRFIYVNKPPMTEQTVPSISS